MTLEKRAHRVVDEVARGVAGDRLDRVAEPLHRPVLVARAAVDGARDVGHQRAQQRLVRAQASGAQPGRHARGQHLGLERDAHHVVGAGVQRRAQLGGGVERGAHDDVRRGELVAARGPPRSARRRAGAGDHDLRHAVAAAPRAPRRRRDAHELDPRGRQNRPAALLGLVQPEQEHPLAFARHACKRACRSHPRWAHDHHGPPTLQALARRVSVRRSAGAPSARRRRSGRRAGRTRAGRPRSRSRSRCRGRGPRCCGRARAA